LARPAPLNALKAPAQVATGRATSLFAPTLAANSDAVAAAVTGKRVLAIGAAGSIGSHTVQTLAGFQPAALHVVDQNENGLAELVRQYWSMPEVPQIADFRTWALDYGAPVMRALLSAEGPYDLVLNFAAIKHVRSEKDAFSLIQMFDTNIVKQARLLGWLAETSSDGRYFCVSTDKAANPVSFMGATKRIMEHVLFDPAFAVGQRGAITSARFANVAFSNGSLLQSFEARLARGEPLACPEGVRRYFVSLEESGHICTLAATLAPGGHIVIPDLDPQAHLVPVRQVAEAFLAAHGLEAAPYQDAAQAKAALATDPARGRWPLILTAPDTPGEKPYEEFVAEGETVRDIGLDVLKAVPWAGLRHGGSVAALVGELEALCVGARPLPTEKDALKALIATLEPAFLNSHIASTKSLDARA